MNELAKVKLKAVLENSRKNYRDALTTLKDRKKSPAFSIMSQELCSLTKRIFDLSSKTVKEFEIRDAGCPCREPNVLWTPATKTLKCRGCGLDIVTDIDYSAPKEK